MNWYQNKRRLLLFGGGSSLVLIGALLGFWAPPKAQAACAAQDTSRGTATITVNVPSTGTYRVWSRIQAPDNTSNSYILEIDDTTCGVVVGDNGSMPTNTWTWVDYQNGTTSNKINVNLSAGNHTVTMIGREDNVKLDRVILTSDTTCVPTGTGDNCANPPDTVPPTVSLNTPSNGATLSGTQNITASASDDVGVTKVDFLIDGTVVGTDTTSPYSFSWNTTTVSNGPHSVVARATDAANNTDTSDPANVTINNGPPAQPDLVITGISWSPPTPDTGNAVTFSATVRNQGTAASPLGINHGVRFDIDGTAVSWAANNTNVSLAPGASVTLTAVSGPSGAATWTATAGSHTVTATVDDLGVIDESNNSNNSLSSTIVVNSPDTSAPTASVTAPANNATVSGTVSITASATDTGGSGMARVEFYIDGTLRATDTTSPYSYSWDSTTISNGSHSIYVRAYDGAGNSQPSSTINVTVNNTVTVKPGDVNGDGIIGTRDLNIISQNWMLSGRTRAQGDIARNDGIVNIFDLNLLSVNWGQ